MPHRTAATEIPSTSDPCVLLLEWDPPSNIPKSDVDHYIVNIPSGNITTNENSTLVTYLIPQCTSNLRINVQAVNHCGQKGPYAAITPRLLSMDNTVVTTMASEPYDQNSVRCTCNGPGEYLLFVVWYVLDIISTNCDPVIVISCTYSHRIFFRGGGARGAFNKSYNNRTPIQGFV